jgi:predicted transcriptional regulator
MTERLTISLPDDVAENVRKRARKSKKPVSRVIADALRQQERAELEERMREGYRAVAEENRRLAEEALPAILEVLPDD